jgi:Replication-relaxation
MSSALTLPWGAPVAVAMLEGIYQHRLLSSQQLHELFRPGRHVRHTQQTLAWLERDGLLRWVRSIRRRRLWFVTDAGARAVEAIPNRAETRRKLIDPVQAAGPLQQHTLAVNDVGLAFVRSARCRGDECGPLHWRHEIAHPLGPPPGRHRPEQLIADALLSYQLNDPAGGIGFEYRFIELDRATMAVDDLAGKLARYARLYRHAGADGIALWQRTYAVFPSLLVVLAGRDRPALERRRETVLALCDQDGQLHAAEVDLAVCLLEDLQTRGPFAPICRHLSDRRTPADWLHGPGEA